MAQGDDDLDEFGAPCEILCVFDRDARRGHDVDEKATRVDDF
jgi:hypothetical protein